MPTPSLTFSAGGTLAMLSWLSLSVSLFLGQGPRSAMWTATTVAVPALLSLA